MHVDISSEAAWRGAPRFVLTGKWTPDCPAVDSGAPTSGMSTWKSSGCSCHLGLLGAETLTAAAAMQAAIAQSSGFNLNPKQFQNAAWLSAAAGFIQAGALPVTPPYGPDCKGQSASNMNLFTTGSGIVISAAGATEGILVATHVISAVTGAIAGAATLGVGVLISVISMIFAHHAAAVKRDLAFGCSALPAVNNAFAVINKAVQAGQTTPAAASQALDQIYSQYESAGGAAINYHPWCNSNCELGVILKGMVIYWQAQYAAMAAKAAASTASSATDLQTQAATLDTQAATALAKGDVATANQLTTQANVLKQQAAAAPAAGGPPSWMLIAAAAVGAFLLLK